MKILKHPDYVSLPVLVAESASDKAQAGKFFVTYSGKYLSHIAKDAYGSGTVFSLWQINKSAYNKANCIYRYSSSSCSSPIVPGSEVSDAPSWSAKTWLSLCNADKNGVGGNGLGGELGVSYQVIWVPLEGKEPWDLEIPGVLETPETPGTPGIINKPSPPSTITTPIVPGTPEEEEVVVPEKAGLPWWLGALLGLGALTTVIYFAVKDKKKGKKGK